MATTVQECFSQLRNYVLRRERPDEKNEFPLKDEILRRSKGPDHQWLLNKINLPHRVDKERSATLLHFASEAGRWDLKTVHLLLELGANPTILDGRYQTPLHWAVSHGCYCDSCNDKSEACVKLLLNMDSNRSCLQRGWNPNLFINQQDRWGDTALHLAARNLYVKAAAVMLDVPEVNIFLKNMEQRDGEGNDTLFTTIVQSVPSILLVKLDRAVSLYSKEDEKFNGIEMLSDEYQNVKDFYGNIINSKELFGQSSTQKVEDASILKLDFSFLTQTVRCERFRGGHIEYEVDRKSECELLLQVLKANKSAREKIFTHPVMEAFLQRKWKRVQWSYVISRTLHFLFCCFYTHYCLRYFLENCTYQSLEEGVPCEAWWNMKLLSRILLGYAAVLVFRQITDCIGTGISKYLSSWGWVLAWWMLIVGVVITTLPAAVGLYPYNWIHALAAFIVFEAWALILATYTRIPGVAPYIEMFVKVMQTIMFCVWVYGFLVLGFAFGFHLMFPDNSEFGEVSLSFVKILNMMIGETDYDGLFGDNDKLDDDYGYLIPSHIFYSGFNILVTIIFMNLLIGLSVSDIQALKTSSKLTGIERQVLAIHGLEKNLNAEYSIKLWNVFGLKWLLFKIQDLFNVITESERYLLFRPYDPNSNKIKKKTQFKLLHLYKSTFHRDSVHQHRLNLPDVFEIGK